MDQSYYPSSQRIKDNKIVIDMNCKQLLKKVNECHFDLDMRI